jgi:hypothetical protein
MNTVQRVSAGVNAVCRRKLEVVGASNFWMNPRTPQTSRDDLRRAQRSPARSFTQIERLGETDRLNHRGACRATDQRLAEHDTTVSSPWPDRTPHHQRRPNPDTHVGRPCNAAHRAARASMHRGSGRSHGCAVYDRRHHGQRHRGVPHTTETDDTGLSSRAAPPRTTSAHMRVGSNSTVVP